MASRWWIRAGAAVVIALAMGSLTLAPGGEQDSDGDGIGDAYEETLGTDPKSADPLQVVLDDGVESEAARKRPGYDATKDVVRVEVGHVGDDRYLWRVTLAQKPRLEDTVLHLYVDADVDEATGRKGSKGGPVTGTDYMLSVVSGRGTSSAFRADATQSVGPVVSHVVDGNTVLMSTDVNLSREAGKARFALYVLCHSTTEGSQPKMSDSSLKKLVDGVPVSDRKKIMRFGDYQENDAVDVTFGENPLIRLLKDPANVVIPHDQLQTDGFVVDQNTSLKWPHLKLEGREGKAWVAAPKAGRYHVGFMMYDDANNERIGLYVNGKLCGVAVAGENNNRTWLYWLKDAQEFRGGERVELRASGTAGRHGICNIVFLAQAPEPRKVSFEVQNMAAAASVDRPGRVTVSWTTTWPCATRFEYGKDTSYGMKSDDEGHCLVHRVVLDGLDPNVEYHGRAIGTARDGSPFVGSDFVFRAVPPAPSTRDGVASVPLSVRNPYSFAIENWPITTGVPFPQGQLGSIDHVRLTDGKTEVPAQIRLTARWLDGSVKWILVSFQANVSADGEQTYQVEYGRDVQRTEPKDVLAKQYPAGVAIDTGTLRFGVDAQGNLVDLKGPDAQRLFATGRSTSTVATDAAGAVYTVGNGKAELTVEEPGPLRTVVKAVSHLTDAKGSPLMRIEKRIEAYRNRAIVRVYHTFVVERLEMFTDLLGLRFRIPVATTGKSWRVPLADGQVLELDAATPTVHQQFDNELFTVSGGKPSLANQRVVGVILAGGDDGCAIAVRDFWQNYPAAFSVRPEGIDVGLCPTFAEGLYDKFPFEREGHHLYYYLLGGKYRLKRGVAKTHEMLLCYEPAKRREDVCQVFQRPLLATAKPEWYCDSKVFYDVAPRDTARFPLYEEAIDKNLKAYVTTRERQHDYGMLNYGDWYGERGANWGNIEYDTQHAFFLEYIRSGNPDAFFLGDATELHNRDIDTVQWSTDPKEIGAVYVHQMGHVGNYYTESVPKTLGIPSGGYTVSHAWVEGHFDHYFLTGDRRSYETGCAVADYFIRKELARPYDFSSCRVPGWHLIMLASAYAATDDPYYLNAAKVVTERVLEAQDQEPRPLPDYQAAGRKPYQQGGWSRMMVPGHCLCEPRHRGNANFMVAVLLAGLKYYHDVTGDPRVKESIIAGAHSLLDECYSDEVKGFRYTSCPNMKYSAGTSPLMVEGIARAYVWTKDERFRRVLTESLPLGGRGSGYGKGFSMYYRMAPRVLADLAAAGLTLEKPVEPVKR